MARKHTRNQSSSPSPCFFSSKESTEKISHQRQETSHSLTTNVKDTALTQSRINQLSSNPFQFVKTRVEDTSSNSLPRQFQTTTTVATNSDQYHYYQTNSSRWLNQNEYKHQNINCWLENVLKNNQNSSEENEELEQNANSDEDEVSTDDESASCLLRTKQRYKPYNACVKRDLPITDQNETNCRQDKIRTLKAMIARHDEHLNELKLCRNMETERQRQNNAGKKFRMERGKNCQIHSNPSRSKSNGKSATKEKKTSFDIRNPNSIFFAVLEEEHIARRSNSGQSCWGCCATETLSGQQDEFLGSHVELENISAS